MKHFLILLNHFHCKIFRTIERLLRHLFHIHLERGIRNLFEGIIQLSKIFKYYFFVQIMPKIRNNKSVGKKLMNIALAE